MCNGPICLGLGGKTNACFCLGFLEAVLLLPLDPALGNFYFQDSCQHIHYLVIIEVVLRYLCRHYIPPWSFFWVVFDWGKNNFPEKSFLMKNIS